MNRSQTERLDYRRVPADAKVHSANRNQVKGMFKWLSNNAYEIYKCATFTANLNLQLN